jgi:hypothetical protein
MSAAAKQNMCPECKDTGVINRKVWDDIPESIRKDVAAGRIHPAAAAGMPAQRTIKQYPCPRGCTKEAS